MGVTLLPCDQRTVPGSGDTSLGLANACPCGHCDHGSVVRCDGLTCRGRTNGLDEHRAAKQPVVPFGAPEHLRVALPSDLCGELEHGEHCGVFLRFPTCS